MTPEQLRGLEVARALVRLGVPVFHAPGVHPPRRWQATQPDESQVDLWRPGDGLGAVMGPPGPFDAVDVDPRSGGDRSVLAALATYGSQETPRGGVHVLIRTLAAGKHQGILPGIDLQGGRQNGSGRGFIWLAPTVRHGRSYRWTTEPALEPRTAGGDGEWIKALVKKAPPVPEDGGELPAQSTPPPAGYVQAFLDEDIPAYVQAEPGTGDTRLWQLVRRAYEFINAGWVERDEILEVLDRARADRIRQHPHGGGQDEGDWERILHSARTSKAAVRSEGLRVGGQLVDGPGKRPAPTEGAPATTAAVEASTGRLKLVRASTVKVKRVRWLRHERIPIGEITLIAGREGTGKSIYLAHLAAKVTRGDDIGEFAGRPRGVIYVASEDSWAHTVAPRLIAAGADLDLVYNVEVDGGGSLTLPDDTDELIEVAKTGDVGLINLDPVVSLIHERYSTDRARELRMAIEPLRDAAEEIDAAVVALVHFNKGDGDVLTKIAGSRGWVEVARAVLGIARDDEAGHAVMSQVKNNLGRLDLPNWAYEIQSHRIEVDDGHADTGKLHWLKKVDSGVADLLAGSQGRGRPVKGRDPRATAAWILGECVADGVDSIDFRTIHRRLGELEGWSERTTRDRIRSAVDQGLLREVSRGAYGELER